MSLGFHGKHHAQALRQALTDVRPLCETLGLLEKGPRTVRRQTGGLMICCPAHEERTPSCSVRLGKDGTIAVKCHACGFSGDVLTLIAQARGLDVRRDFHEVLREAARLAGWGSPVDERRRPSRRPPEPLRRETSPKPKEPTELEEASFNRIASELLRRCPLRQEPSVLNYLASRGLAEEAEARGFGALPEERDQGSWLATLSASLGAPSLGQTGLVGKGKTKIWSPLHRLLIPWRAPDGTILALQRRVIGPPPPHTPKYLFAAGRPAPLHPFDANEAVSVLASHPDAEVAFVEGALDVLAMHALNARRAQPKKRAIFGIPSATLWRPEWAAYARGRTALIGLDEDAAGKARVQEVARDLYGAGAVRVQRAKPPMGKDWGEVLEKYL